MICGTRTNDLFDKVLFGRFGLSFVLDLSLELVSVRDLEVGLGFFWVKKENKLC